LDKLANLISCGEKGNRAITSGFTSRFVVGGVCITGYSSVRGVHD